jgi:predicted negative regulator of RcsB-dependent stress response
MSRFSWTATLSSLATGFLIVGAAADDLKSCGDGKASGKERTAACTRVIESGSNLKWAFVSRGNAYFDMGNTDTAIANYTEAIGIDAKYTAAINNRANAYMAKGDFVMALANSSVAVQLDPKDPAGFETRGEIYRKMGDLDHAIADFDEAIRLDPQYTGALTQRGMAYEAKNDVARARDDYQAALALPSKYKSGARALDTAREHLRALPPPATPATMAKQTADNSAEAPSAQGSGQASGVAAPAVAAPRRTATPLPTAPPKRVEAPAVLAPALPAGEAGSRVAVAPAAAAPRQAATPPNTPPTAAPKHVEAPAPAPVLTPALPASEAGPKVAVAPPAVAPPVVAPPVVAPSVEAPAVPAAAAEAPAPAALELAALPPNAPPTAAPKRVDTPLDRRVALVIGNSNYATLPFLATPRQDAEDVAGILGTLGFEVLVGTDLKRAEMEELVIRFARLARSADTALVFYAGHAIQHNGENYLASVDAVFEDEADLRKYTILRDIVRDLQGAGRARILIVDACRDDQVVARAVAKLPAARAAALGNGLAWMSGAEGTLVAFAAQANRTATDSNDRNSRFTQALLKQLPTPGIELRTMMTRVRSDVTTATHGTQRPELFDSLPSEVVLGEH